MNDKEIFQRFIGRPVKLKWKNGFILIGEITDCSDDFIIFKTTTKTSMINKSEIDSVQEM